MAYSPDRRSLVKLALGAPFAMPSAGQKQTPIQDGRPRPVLEAFEYEGVRLLDGMLKTQLDSCRNYYNDLADDAILKGFRERAGRPAPGAGLGGWYGGDTPPATDWPHSWPRLIFSRGDMFNTFGQWLSGMSRMTRATSDQPMLSKAIRLMTEWAKTIEPDGYFFYSRNPIAPQYTYDKTACGLIDLYQYGGSREALPLLERITDWAVRNLDRARVNPTPAHKAGVAGNEWYTLSENLYRAYLLTGNSKYKSFGDVWRYPLYWDMFSGKAEPAPYGLHAYSHCNTLSSAAMTYVVTGEPRYLSTIVNAYDWFNRTQFYATGGYGPGETLLPPDGSLGRSLETTANHFETPCGCWAGFKLARYLISLTGESHYGDWIEKLIYNGIGAALPMGPSGQTFYFSDYRLGGGRKVYSAASYPCCSGTYLQAVADYHNLIYFKDGKGLNVNLYVPSSVTCNFDDAEVRVEQQTAYPESDTITLTVRPTRPIRFDIRFRVPRWAQTVRASVNGTPMEIGAHPGRWAAVRRTWANGDRLVIRIPLPVYLSPVDRQHPKRVAVMRGPVVLVRQNEVLEFRGDPAECLTASGEHGGIRGAGKFSADFVPFYCVGLQAPYTMYFDLAG